jgi:hypothetical protein
MSNLTTTTSINKQGTNIRNEEEKGLGSIDLSGFWIMDGYGRRG